MTRRAFITLLGGAAVWPLAPRAQTDVVRRIGVLMHLSSQQGSSHRTPPLLFHDVSAGRHMLFFFVPLGSQV
jgi:hypothetical protein